MKYSLVADKVCFGYRGRQVLDSVSFSVKPGELVGFLGPNGSGKSTFLKNLLGFLKPESGEIIYQSCGDTKPCPAELARLLAFVPQQSGLRSSITVTDAVLMGRLPHMKDRWAGYSLEDRERVRYVVDSMGLRHLAERPVVCLSGGELQKVVIARALVQESGILLLDEATAGLDLNHAVEIMELMRRKASEESKAIVAVLHDLNLASAFCDRIVLLKNGRIRYEGLPADVITESVLEEIYGFRAMVGMGDDGKPFVLPRRSQGTCAQGAVQKGPVRLDTADKRSLDKERKLPNVC